VKKWKKNDIKKTSKEEIEKLKRDAPVTLIKFLLPFACSGLLIYGMFLTGTDMWWKFSQFAAVYLFTPGGILTGPFLALQQFGIGLTNLIFFIIFLDAMTSLFIFWNLDLFRAVPGLGYLIKRAETNGQRILNEKPKLRKYAFAGIVLFVLIPLYMSGSIIGSIIARLIGMKKWRGWLAIMTGVSIRMVFLYLFVNGVKFLWFFFT